MANQGCVKKKLNRWSVRRSERIKNCCTPQAHKEQKVIEEITLSETDEDDELLLPAEHYEEKNLAPTMTNQETTFPELMMGEKNLEEKIDYLVQLLEAQAHTIASLKSEAGQGSKNGLSVEAIAAPHLKYKSLYIASQIKIEELAEENRRITLKLDNAVDECEAYKKAIRDAFGVMENLKDEILVSSTSNVSEVAPPPAIPQAVNEHVVSSDVDDVPSAKRKKPTLK